MEQQHTQEPWFIGTPPPNGEQTIGTHYGLMVAVATTGASVSSEANARRIVACVNACAGISNDVLEQYAALMPAVEHCKELEKQRDELLAELEFQRDRNYNPFEPDCQSNNYKRLCDAIASGKGGAA